MNLFSVKDKKIILTGGATGLGKGIAEGYLQHGANVCIIDVNPAIKETIDELSKLGSVYGVSEDLSMERGRIQAFDSAKEKLGGIDVLVNCAGIQRRNFSEDFSLDDWQAVLDVNLTAVFHLCQLAGREMIKKGYGKIINIASMLSFFGGYTVPAYAASKGGVAQLTKALSNEWMRKGVCVNAIAPGYMATQMNTALIENEDRNREILARIPAKRWGTPDDVKGVALFLSTAASDYISGAIVPVDGGYLAY